VLLEKVEKTKLGAAAKPRSNPPIRPATDKIRRPTVPSRHVPREVKRAVYRRDAGQCAFVSPNGRRCTERTFLEFHHVQPYARQGPATVANISLRCRRHNQYEAEQVFGPHGPSIVREACTSPWASFSPDRAGQLEHLAERGSFHRRPAPG
jgi:5-methylcytosine-specific restriction endonuclease McrA